jgi:hypothetical protein
MNMGICGSFQSAKNNWVRKSQTRKMPHLRKVRKSKKIRVRKFAICETYLRPDKNFLPQINKF